MPREIQKLHYIYTRAIQKIKCQTSPSSLLAGIFYWISGKFRQLRGTPTLMVILTVTKSFLIIPEVIKIQEEKYQKMNKISSKTSEQLHKSIFWHQKTFCWIENFDQNGNYVMEIMSTNFSINSCNFWEKSLIQITRKTAVKCITQISNLLFPQ